MSANHGLQWQVTAGRDATYHPLRDLTRLLVSASIGEE